MKKFIIELKECLPTIPGYMKQYNPKCIKCSTPSPKQCQCPGEESCDKYLKCNAAFKAEQKKRNTKDALCSNPTNSDHRKRRFLRCKDCKPSETCHCNKCPYCKICQEMYKGMRPPPKPKQPKHPFPWSRIPKLASPTGQQANALIVAFDHFNKELFAGQLTRPMLTLSRDPINKLGYFAPLKWYNPKGEHAHELGINANLFFTQDIVLFFTAFIHEMIHIFQYDITENPGQPGVHNKEYIDTCKEIGLKTIPQAGDNLHTELIEGGRAYKAILTLPKECVFPYMSHPSAPDGTPIPQEGQAPTGGAGQPQPGGEGEPGQGQCQGQPGETAGEPSQGGAGQGQTMPDGTSRPRPGQAGKKTGVNIPMTGKRAKYTCPICGLNAWAKPGALLICGGDKSYLVEVKG